MLAIIDYQAGNQTSVRRALDSLGLDSTISADPEALRRADGLIFPGVGAAGQAMNYLSEHGLDALIKNLVADGRPLLGVCLGCQILLDFSEENETPTLGILPGRSRRFDPSLKDEAGDRIRVPHMGWNAVRQVKKSVLFEGIDDRAQFYFVHGYYPEPAPESVLGRTTHGLDFASVFGRDGLWAAQFHPEKSGPAGLRLLKNFYVFCHKGQGWE